MPEDGKVYVFTNVATNGTKHYFYENNTAGQLQWAERGESDVNTLPANGKYICRKNGTYYTFVNIETGLYLIWKGSNGGYNNNKGYEEAYNEADCKLFVERAQYTTSNMGNASSQEDLFGWTCLGGVRSGYSGIDKCFLYTVNSGFNQDSNHTQRYGSNHSTMFIVEEASYPYNTANLQYDKGDEVTKQGPTYSTIYLPFAMAIPAGVKAYGVTGTRTKSDEEVMDFNKVADGEQDTDVPVGGYLLYSETESGSTTILPAASNPETVDNDFTGSTATDASLPSGTRWVLGKKNGIGFYKYTSSTYPLGKAIYITESSEARLAFDFEDIETAIQAVEKGTSANVEIYDLSGRRVEKAQKGIYIINRKKVMFK